jgi:hypothetical protein
MVLPERFELSTSPLPKAWPDYRNPNGFNCFLVVGRCSCFGFVDQRKFSVSQQPEQTMKILSRRIKLSADGAFGTSCRGALRRGEAVSHSQSLEDFPSVKKASSIVALN